jgi:hypothetical protein
MAAAPEIPAFVPVAPAPVTPRTTSRAPANTLAAAPGCPVDNGVTLSINSVKLLSEGSALDSYAMTMTLENHQSARVTLSTIDLIRIVPVYANGSEMPGSSLVLPFPYTYDVPPGRHTFALDPTDYVTIYHGYGSPVTAFKLTGEVRVANSSTDMSTNSRYCPFSDVVMGPPLQGSWGT